MSEAPASLFAALALLQTKLPEIRKTQTAEVETNKGRNYSYTYANLAGISAQIMPLLGDLGLSFIAKPTFSGDRFVLAYSLLHTSGEREDGEYPLPTSGTPQAIGSAITYGRRYCLCAVTGVAPEDDDDGAAAEAEAETQRGTARRSRQTRAPQGAARPVAQRASAQVPPLPGEAPGDLATRSQLGNVMALFRDMGIADREKRLAVSSRIVGHELATANDLTQTDASKLIDALSSIASESDSEARLTALIDAEQVPDGDPLAYVAPDVAAEQDGSGQ